MKMSEFRNLPQEEQRRLWDDLGPSGIANIASQLSANVAELAKSLMIDPQFLAWAESKIAELDAFLHATGKDRDDVGVMDFGELINDARTILAILEKYNARNYIPPSPPPKRGIVPDGFWDDMARREASGEFKRADTTREYRRLYASHASAYTSKAPLDSYVRQKIYQARKRLGIPPRQKKS